MRDIPCETREDTIRLRRKLFTLIYRHYLEEGFYDLLITCFPVKKADDIRAVWNTKSNGLNATLWAPKFAMATFADVEGIVVRWLLVPLLAYLEAGSPVQDLTLDQGCYIKSVQYDSDVGQMFHNFLMHAKERHSHGVCVTHTRGGGQPEEEPFLRWCVLNFGCKCSPYVACQGEERIIELS